MTDLDWNKWEVLDDYSIHNEETKTIVEWLTYGDNEQYFLSREYIYDGDMYERENGHVLVNEEITKDITFEDLIEKTKNML